MALCAGLPEMTRISITPGAVTEFCRARVASAALRAATKRRSHSSYVSVRFWKVQKFWNTNLLSSSTRMLFGNSCHTIAGIHPSRSSDTILSRKARKVSCSERR